MEILDCVTLTPELADAFAPLIPASVLEELRAGRVLGLGSLLDDLPNGAVVFQVEGSAARVLSLYVDQYDRRNGTGRFLMEKLRAVLQKLPGVYSIRVSLPEGASPAFFQALGARVETGEGGTVRFPLSALEGSPLFTAPRSSCCLSGEQLGQEVLDSYRRSLKAGDMDLYQGSLWDAPVRRDLSRYYVKDGEIRGCAVMTETETGLCLAMLINQGDRTVLATLLGALLRCLTETCPPETEISLEAVTPETRELLERLVPGAARDVRRVAVLPV